MMFPTSGSSAVFNEICNIANYMVYYIDMKESNFLWDDLKNEQNRIKHKVGFEFAQYAFNDPKRVIARDRKHSTDDEQRFFLLWYR